MTSVQPPRSPSTYLTPAFGMLWGALFLAEALTLPMLAGAALVILGTVFVLRS